MTAFAILLCTTIRLGLSMAAAYFIGWLLTEHFQPIINRKPFNCRPCLTFWLTAAGGLAQACSLSPSLASAGATGSVGVAFYGIAGVGFLTAFINFLIVKQKTFVYE